MKEREKTQEDTTRQDEINQIICKRKISLYGI